MHDQITDTCTCMHITCTNRHVPGWEPTVVDRMQCWRWCPSSTQWCGWPGGWTPQRNQTLHALPLPLLRQLPLAQRASTPLYCEGSPWSRRRCHHCRGRVAHRPGSRYRSQTVHSHPVWIREGMCKCVFIIDRDEGGGIQFSTTLSIPFHFPSKFHKTTPLPKYTLLNMTPTQSLNSENSSLHDIYDHCMYMYTYSCYQHSQEWYSPSSSPPSCACRGGRMVWYRASRECKW